MAVDFGLEDYGFRIRPVVTADAQDILKLRTDPERGRFLGPTDTDVKVQYRWIENQRKLDGDYYYAIEKVDGSIEGFIGLYGISNLSGEWGRWVVRQGSLAAPASILLILKLGFERIGLEQIYCRTLDQNLAVVRLHDQCRYTSRQWISDYRARACVQHTLCKEDWPEFRNDLEAKAHRVSSRILQK